MKITANRSTTWQKATVVDWNKNQEAVCRSWMASN